MSVPKAAEAMKSNSSQTPSNMDAQREGFFDQCSSFGANAGAGEVSKVGWFQATVEAAWQGIIVPAAGRRKKGDISSPLTDAEIAYKRFADARKAKAGEMGKKLAEVVPQKGDYNTRVSEANRMIILGSLPHIHEVDQGGLGVFERALKFIREDDEITGQVDKLLLDVARRQCDDPENLLTDDQIKAILRPEDEGPKEETEEVELWGNVQRQIQSIMTSKYPDTAGESQDAKTALNAVIRRVDALGGTAAMARAREKKAKAEREAKEKAKIERQGARKKKR